MKTIDKLNSIRKVVDDCGKLEINLNLSKAERIVLSQWIAKLSATAYDKGFEDGQKLF